MRRNLSVSMSTLALAAFTGFGAPAAFADRISVELNGDPVKFYGTQPREVDGRVMVPLRGVLEKMGATVDWISRSQTVIASKGDMELELPIGSRTAKVNDRSVRLDVPAMTIAGSTMVPLRFVSEALGADVAWSGRTQTVAISTEGRIARNDREFYRGDRNNRNNRDNFDNRDNIENRNARRFSRTAAIPAGTVIPLKLDETLRSDEAQEGDRFTATVQAGRDDAGLPDGTRFQGVVREVIAASGGKPGVLYVEFNRVIFPDGTARDIDGRVVQLDAKSTTRDSDGRLVAKSGSRNDEQLKWVGIGAGAGLLISTLTKGNTLVDTILGAGAGYLYSQLQRKGAGNVNLKAGTEVGVKLDTRLTYPRE